jgi:hypothetical protein
MTAYHKALTTGLKRSIAASHTNANFNVRKHEESVGQRRELNWPSRILPDWVHFRQCVIINQFQCLLTVERHKPIYNRSTTYGFIVANVPGILLTDSMR